VFCVLSISRLLCVLAVPLRSTGPAEDLRADYRHTRALFRGPPKFAPPYSFNTPCLQWGTSIKV
jgi:hypothetical protein